MAGIVLHQFEVSPFCDKIRRVLDFKRLTYETREVAPTETLTRLRRLNPAGKVPVLDHQGELVADSSAIARFLDARYPDPPLYPSDARGRALCHVLEDWADESLYFFELWFRFGLAENAGEWSRRTSESEPPLLRRATERALPTLMRNVLRLQGLGRRPPEQVLEEFGRHLDAVQDGLGEEPWLVGDRVCLADIAVYAQISAAAETGEASGLVGERPRLMDWMARVNAVTSPIA